MAYNLPLRPIPILSSHLRLCLSKGLFLVGVPVKILKTLLLSSILAHVSYLNLVDLITLTILGERYKLWSPSMWSLLHSPFSSLLGPNIRLRILFSKWCHSEYTLLVSKTPLDLGNTSSILQPFKISCWTVSKHYLCSHQAHWEAYCHVCRI